LKYNQNGNATTVDASKINSAECFREWSANRTRDVHDAARMFRRSLSAHITGSDGRRPFNPEEERAILQVVRCKRRWPAFEDSNLTIGIKGFQSFGFHEKKRYQSNFPLSTPQELAGASEPTAQSAPSSLQFPIISDGRPNKMIRPGDPSAGGNMMGSFGNVPAPTAQWPPHMYAIPPFYAYPTPVYHHPQQHPYSHLG